MSTSFVNPEGNSRKRVRISRDSEPTMSEGPITSVAMRGAATTSTAPNPINDITNDVEPAEGSTTNKACHHEQALQSLHTDLDAMRGLITCQVCHRFMYEPYALSCGHTYCYSCLSQWFGGKTKKTCPDCRAAITQQPTPSYLIKEMVLIFANRTQLLPDGETSDEHHKYAREEAEIVSKEKNDVHPQTGGLFKGSFRPGAGRAQPVRDTEDGVERCPNCHWEIEDGFCGQCGIPVGEGYESDDSVESLDDDGEQSISDADGWEDDEDDGFGPGVEVDINHRMLNGHGVHMPGFGQVYPIPHGGPRRQQMAASSDMDSAEEDDQGSMDGFVVGDHVHEYDSESESESSEAAPEDDSFVGGNHGWGGGIQSGGRLIRPPPVRRGRATVVLSSDDDEDDDNTPAPTTSTNPQVIDDSDDESVDTLPPGRAIKRSATGRRSNAIEISDEEEQFSSSSSDAENENSDEDEDSHGPSSGTPAFQFRRQPTFQAHDEPESEDDDDGFGGYDNDNENDTFDGFGPNATEHEVTWGDEDSEEGDEEHDESGTEDESEYENENEYKAPTQQLFYQPAFHFHGGAFPAGADPYALQWPHGFYGAPYGMYDQNGAYAAPPAVPPSPPRPNRQNGHQAAASRRRRNGGGQPGRYAGGQRRGLPNALPNRIGRSDFTGRY